MFTHSHEEHSVITRSSPRPLQTRVTRWAAWCSFAGLAVAVAGALVLIVSQVVFGREPIGGDSGLVLLYLATAIAGIGLAVLGRIMPIERRSSGFTAVAPFSIESSPPPEGRTDTREAA
jgi:hypothetical protein